MLENVMSWFEDLGDQVGDFISRKGVQRGLNFIEAALCVPTIIWTLRLQDAWGMFFSILMMLMVQLECESRARRFFETLLVGVSLSWWVFFLKFPGIELRLAAVPMTVVLLWNVIPEIVRGIKYLRGRGKKSHERAEKDEFEPEEDAEQDVAIVPAS